MSSNNIYYVYAYLRNKNSKTANVGTPYYIGLGSKKRAWQKHKNVTVPDDNNIVILFSGLDWYQAHDLEVRMIRWYGRKDLSTGILINRTNGGEGTRGYSHTQLTKDKISKAHKGRPGRIPTAEQRQRMSDSHKGLGKGKKISDEQKRQIGLANSYPRSDETKKRMSESAKMRPSPAKGRKMSDEQKQKLSIANRGKKQSDETKQKRSLALKGRPGRKQSDDTKRKISETLRNRGETHIR